MMDLEYKFMRMDGRLALEDETGIAGYASLFGSADQGGDVVEPGAYAASLARLEKSGARVRMLWQHDPREVIGIWDAITEDARGLHVRGRIITDVARGREAAALVAAGAIDGLSIGYRTKRATRDAGGHRRLHEIELWEVSLVTFPMLQDARIGAKAGGNQGTTDAGALQALSLALRDARRIIAGKISEQERA